MAADFEAILTALLSTDNQVLATHCCSRIAFVAPLQVVWCLQRLLFMTALAHSSVAGHPHCCCCCCYCLCYLYIAVPILSGPQAG